MEEYNITRAKSLEESDYLIYITCTCAGVGDKIKNNLKEIQALDYLSLKYNIKVIIVGCLVINHGYLFEKFKCKDNFKIIDDKEWVIPVINYINDINKRNNLKEKLQKNYKRIMALKNYKDQVIRNKMFVGVCNLIDKHGLEDRKIETLERIKKS